MGGEIPTARAAVVALATGGILASAVRSGVLTRRAGAHRCQVYPAPEDFTNSVGRSGGEGDMLGDGEHTGGEIQACSESEKDVDA